jgi:hypothetical protein
MDEQPVTNRNGSTPDARRFSVRGATRVRPIDVGHHRFHYGAYGLGANVRPSEPRRFRFRYGAYGRDARVRPIEIEHHRFHFGVYQPVGK